jgi:hypothetical protein
MSSLKLRDSAFISLSPAADYSAKKGYLVGHDGATATVSASATTRAKGVIVEANKGDDYTVEKVTVALLGSVEGTLPMCAGGAISAGDWVQQDTDGQVVTDAGSGNRVIVGQALESAVAGDIIEVAPCTPTPLS